MVLMIAVNWLRLKIARRSFFSFFGLILISATFYPAVAQKIDSVERQTKQGGIRLWRGGGRATAYANLALTHLLQARAVGDWAEIDSAKKFLSKAQSLDRNHAEVLWSAANIHLYQHHFQEMFETGNRMIEIYPNDPRGYGAAGDASLELGNLEAAKIYYATMIRLRRNFHSLNRLARITNVLGNTDEALALMQEAILKAGKEATNHRHWAKVMMASFEMGRGQLLPAEKILLQVIKENPYYTFALEHLGEIYGFVNRDTDADRMYERAFSRRPEPAYAIAWSNVKRRLGQTAQADTLDKIAERALQNHVEAGRVAYLRELAKYYLGKNENEKIALQLAIQDTTIRHDTEAFTILAWALQQNVRYEDAWKIIKKAIIRPDTDAMAYYRAGAIRAKLGDKAAAEKYMLKAVKLNPFWGWPEAEKAKMFLRNNTAKNKTSLLIYAPVFKSG